MIGQLKERLTLSTPQKIPNGRGGWTIDRNNPDRVTIWGAFELLSITKQLRYMELDQAANGQFIIRNRPGITKETRIEWAGSSFEIVNFGPHPKKGGYTVINVREA